MFDDTNIKIFDNWAKKDKDIGMEKGHYSSVEKMLNIIKNKTDILNGNFSFLDLGCGNGWVVRKFSENKMCDLSVGVDGSFNMIKKAKQKDSIGKYYHSTIEQWDIKLKFDIIFSMETFYYFEDINYILNKIFYKLLKNNSFFIFGIDHYSENTPSLNWESDIGIKTKTRTIDEWINIVKKIGFKDIKFLQFGKKEDWAGTLIIYAKKY